MQTASSSCPSFFKDHICKHLVGFAANMKLVKIPIEAKQALEYQSEADKEERVVSSIKVLKRKITEVEEETPQETVIPTKKNKKTIDKEAEKVVQSSTSSDISKKEEAPLKRGRDSEAELLICE
ncbi:hypothetical protein BpHYR1_020193 [Brachionus plicatilis]|uniref:SWIM-type domain-containing protein n=1 Tax=Brachionus plicatilis TaxID=10195 RepID=A0A3M7QCW1_BRAPC|nr:hypothetical protein BpHYR1_020193 [Brachionus plicatilis]